MTIKTSRVGDVLKLNRNRIEPLDAEQYRQIGVYSWGKGIIKNQPKPGYELSKVAYYEFPTNALVLSNIQAWESAIAVSDERHARFIASQRFLPYTPIDPQLIDVRFACHYFLSQEGIAQIRKASPGSITRNRTLGIAAFENLRIPLPDIGEQRAIAARLDAALGVADSSNNAAGVLDESLSSFLVSLFRGSHKFTPLNQLLQETKRFEPLDPASWYSSAGVRWYAEGVFARESKPGNEFKSTQLNRLQAGEFIYNRLFAWKGSFALIPEQPLHASNEFPTFSIDETRIMPEYLLGWFSLPAVWDEVLRLSTGATPTSRNRFKQEQLLQLQIPLPPMDEQESVVHTIRQLRCAQVLNSSRKRIAKALPQAARNAEFARLMG